jgi:hypothetical protein
MSKNLLSIVKKVSIAFLLVSVACVDPYLKRFTGTEDILIIEAVLSDQRTGNYVKLTQSLSSDGASTSYLPLKEAQVSVKVNDSENINLEETASGYYTFPGGFKGETGNTYQLILTSDGKTFESSKETMLSRPKIDKIYHEFDANGLKDNQGRVSPSQKIYIDTSDPEESRDFYMWTWTLYEEQFWCKTCIDGYYYRDNSTGPLGECREERFRRGKFDYQCDTKCWDIIPQREVNIMKDEFSNGQTIKARLVANLPIYQLISSLLKVQQFRINEETFNYLNLVRSQSQTTGGLADTPPVTLAGNVSCTTNIDQAVAGYFIVASTDQRLYWLDRKDIPPGTPFLGILDFDGRRPRPEPPSLDTTRPPMAPCENSEKRTSYKPEGWLN